MPTFCGHLLNVKPQQSCLNTSEEKGRDPAFPENLLSSGHFTEFFYLHILQMRKVELREVKKLAHVSWLISNGYRSIGSQLGLIPRLGIFPLHGAACKFLDSMLQKRKKTQDESRWWGGWGYGWDEASHPGFSDSRAQVWLD